MCCSGRVLISSILLFISMYFFKFKIVDSYILVETNIIYEKIKKLHVFHDQYGFCSMQSSRERKVVQLTLIVCIGIFLSLFRYRKNFVAGCVYRLLAKYCHHTSAQVHFSGEKINAFSAAP